MVAIPFCSCCYKNWTFNMYMYVIVIITCCTVTSLSCHTNHNLIYIYITILVFCLSVCVSYLRYRKQHVVSPCFFHWQKELRLASCTNCFSSICDAQFHRKSFWYFLTGYVLTAVHFSLHFWICGAGFENCLPVEHHYHFQKKLDVDNPWCHFASMKVESKTKCGVR